MGNTDKKKWHRNRILWRANRHQLPNKQCRIYKNVSVIELQIISKIVNDDIDPVLVFWDNDEKWTVLGTVAVCSYFDGELSTLLLDEIVKDEIGIPEKYMEEGMKPKENAEFLFHKITDTYIWVPRGSELFALWSILRMFPLGVPKSP